MTYYIEIVEEDNIEFEKSVAVIDRDNATRYDGLRSIALRSANIGDVDEVEIEHEDGTVERIRGYLIDSGGVE